MKIDKKNKNFLKDFLGDKKNLHVVVFFRCGEKAYATLEEDSIKSYEGESRYHFSWDKGNKNITTDVVGQRYGNTESDYDVISILNMETQHMTLKSQFDAVAKRYDDLSAQVYNMVRDIIEERGGFVDLQSKDCEAIYTNIFNDKAGRNEEYRVVALLVRDNRRLYMVGVRAEEEDVAMKAPFTEKELKDSYNNGGNRYLRCLWCSALSGISEPLLYSTLARYLYPHLM